MRTLLTRLLSTALVSVSASAESEPERIDFFLMMQSCKMVAASVEAPTGVAVQDGVLLNYACRRDGPKVQCVVAFEGGGTGHKGNDVTFSVLVDSPPVLALISEGDKAADFVMVSTVEHLASSSSRQVHETWAGTKVCQGMFVTDQEYRDLKGKAGPG